MDKILVENSLGIFFSCYKENEAVRFCIDNIRDHYPQAIDQSRVVREES